MGGQKKIWEEEGARGRRGTSPSRDMVSHNSVRSQESVPVRRESDKVKEMAEQQRAQPTARCAAQLWFTGREQEVFNRVEWEVSDQRPTLANPLGSSGRRKTTQIWNPGPTGQSSRERGSVHILLLIVGEL